MADSPELQRRLAELEDRVRILERRLAMRSALHREEPVHIPAIEAAAEAAPDDEPRVVVDVPAVAAALPATAAREPAPVSTSPPIQPGPTWPAIARAASPSPAAFDLERTIGARWFAAIGAVVVVIGVGLFVRLAYQKGWLNLIPPAGKCLSGATFGVLLVIAGEIIRRKLGALGSAGVSAAGLGALFAATYASYGIYSLVPAPVAFGLLAACAALGFFISARGNLVSIGVISLVAAYANPFIIGEATAGPLVLPAYIFALLCTALALSAWRAFPFRPLRALAWWGTLIYGGYWCADAGLNYPGAALAFLGAVWAAVHTELALASRHPDLGAPATDLEIEVLWNRARFIATSFSSTAWTTALAVNVLREGARIADWWPPAVVAVLASALAIRLAGNLRILRDVPKSDLERLGAGLAMQAGALLMTSVALAFSGWLEVTAWLSLGLAAIGAGRWIRSRGLDIYGLIALCIAAGRLITYDSPFMSSQPWAVDLGGIIITRWAILMALGAAAWAIASRLLRPPPATGSVPRLWRGLGVASLVVALSHLNISLIHPDADASAVCVAWLVLGLAGFLLGRSMQSRALVGYGIVILIASTIRFLFAAPLTGAPSGVLFELAGLVITRWTVLMLIGGTAWFAAAALLRDLNPLNPVGRSGPQPLSPRAALVGIGASMVFASLLHPHAQASSLAHAWLVLAAMAAAAHSLFRRVALDVCALAGLVAVAIAWTIAYPLHWMDSTALLPREGLISALLIAGASLGIGAWLGSPRNPGRPTQPELLRAVVPGVAILLFASTSLEVARIAGVLSSEPTARRAAVSIWWGFVAVGLITAGFWRRVPIARHAGLALLIIATGKAAIFDLAFVPQIWRVASFVGLGLLMLGVAVAYAKVAARSARPTEAP